ncbi:MAG: thioredoxin-disulfide reductase [Bacilli bacterium]|nr:thioredoxin-disulfide reductase [Bacilli bacterium]
MYDIIIVGAGPAGLTAALYAARANKKVLVFEAKSPGGQIINAHLVTNYPGVKSMSGSEFAENLYNQVIDLGVEIKFETVLSIDEDKNVITNKDTYKAKSIILATGADNRKLNIENEDKLVGKGISYCATCDGNFYKNKVVAVVGGGNVALEDVLYLSDIVSKVYLIHRRDSFKGSELTLKEIEKKDNVEILYNSTVTKINGVDKVESIVINNNEQDQTIKIDCLFVAIGQEPKNIVFKNVIDIDEKGFINTKDGVHTNIEGIYVAGDARNKLLKQLTTAVSDGSIAATVAIKEMEK